MHHLYPSLKGDQLCPLGFHPQTRYPTRCKRCFRDYKEHGARRGAEDIAASSPNLSDGPNARPSTRSWTSTQNLSTTNGNSVNNEIELKKRPQSWASTPDIDEPVEKPKLTSVTKQTSHAEENNVKVTLKLPVPPRRHTTALDIKEVENTKSASNSSSNKSIPDDLVILSTDSLAERVRKMNLLKKQRSLNSRESSRERSVPKNEETVRNDVQEINQSPDRPQRSKSGSSLSEIQKSSLPPKKVPTSSVTTNAATGIGMQSDRKSATTSTNKNVPTTNQVASNHRLQAEKQKTSEDVEFMLNLKDHKTHVKRRENDIKSTTTETTETTLVGANEAALQDEIKFLQAELEKTKARMERAERDKSDILLRRLASMETAPNRTAASEALMLQQKVNELKEQLEKVNEEKRRLNQRMKELENSPHNLENDLKRKLNAAEQICEELMEENQEAKREIMNLQAEMEELQDSFREDEVKAKTSLQKDLEKATKNCRILSFKLKKSERKIETLELEKQSAHNSDLIMKIKKLEEELRFSNELSRKLQAEAEELRTPGKKKTPMLGILGKSTSADAKITRESLTRGGSQEDSQQLLRDLQDSVERESDLKDQLKFAEEEAENLRKKVARFEDENESLMMQLKKMATRSRTRKLSPTPSRNHLTPEVHADRDEGISDEDDPAELRILLELNEQEASILRIKVDELEKQNTDARKQIKEMHEKVMKSSVMPTNTSDKKLKALNDELMQLRKTNLEKDRTIDRMREEIKSKADDSSYDMKRQLNLMEREASILRGKIVALEGENEKLQIQCKNITTQTARKNESSSDFEKIKEERDSLALKLKNYKLEAERKLPPRTPKRITDLTPKNHLKKWIEELEEEINDMRLLLDNSGAEKLKEIEMDKKRVEDELQKTKRKLSLAEGDIQRLKTLTNSTTKIQELEHKNKKTEDEFKKANSRIKELEEKIKKQENLIMKAESTKSLIDVQAKNDKEKIAKVEKDFEKEHQERTKLESKLAQVESELANTQKASEKSKTLLQKEIKELKSKSSSSKVDSKVTDLNNKIDELKKQCNDERKRYEDLNVHWEKMSEETVLMRAQLTTEKENLITELNTYKQKLAAMDSIRIERTEFAKKLNEAQKKITELEAKNIKGGFTEQEKQVLKNKLAEKEHEYERLKRENEMNIDLVFQLRKENDDLNSKLNDFNRINQAQSNLNGHNASLDAEMKALKTKLQNAELQLKSEVASTRLRYEQQMKNLSAELTAMQRQCERFKKDRDAFKQMLESAQKKIGELKANNTGRQSRTSMHSSDDDDKSKIAYLEQQIGCLEDQLVEARLEVSKVKTELVSERSANEIKISEMQSKLNEFEEERVIGSGRTKIPGMKTKLELSWQKEREDQQRLLQETSTLARDLRQTLFEVERERDKERLESKRRLDQIKRSTEEELEEGRNKIAELQCDLLELRDVHAKLRTSNEKLRRERERYEKELIKRRMEQDGGERKVGALLQTVDELVKIAPDIKIVTSQHMGNTLRPEQTAIRRARSPSPTGISSQISNVLARLAEASDELRKFQRINEEEQEKNRIRRGNLRRAASQENDPHGSTSSVASATSTARSVSRLSKSSNNHSSLIRKSLSLDHSIQKDQNIWRQDDGSLSSMQSIDSQMTGFDSNLDSRLSGGSTQSDIPRAPRKKKKSLMGKLRSLTKSGRNSESEISIQGSDSDISVASDMRSSKNDLRGRLSGMFKRSASTSRSGSTERTSSEHRPVAVTVVGEDDAPERKDPLSANSITPKPIRAVSKPPAGTPTTPLTKRRVAK